MAPLLLRPGAPAFVALVVSINPVVVVLYQCQRGQWLVVARAPMAMSSIITHHTVQTPSPRETASTESKRGRGRSHGKRLT